jgi:hypothetical protein
MLQTLFLFLAPSQEICSSSSEILTPERRMAVKPVIRPNADWKQRLGFYFSVAGNTLGLMLFFAGLLLVLRLVEVLLA